MYHKRITESFAKFAIGFFTVIGGFTFAYLEIILCSTGNNG